MDQDTEMTELDEGSQPSSSSSNGDPNSLRRDQMECTPNCGISPTKDYRRFRVRKWTAIALWAYDISVDNCAICRNHIMDKCIECQSKQEARNVEGDDCVIAWGKCSHVFHMHCIHRWLNTRQVCPLDNRNWELKKVGN